MINTLIFDFAGVVTKQNFTPVLVRACKEKLGLDEQDVKSKFLEFLDPLLTGEKSARDLWENVCRGTSVSYDSFVEVFGNAYEVNEEAIQLIKRLKSKYRIVMLSDNFHILSENIRENQLLSGLFEKTFFSNEIGLSKTMPGCFEYMLKELQAQPESCLFTDDKEKNLVPARRLGITVIQFNNPKQFEAELLKVGVKA